MKMLRAIRKSKGMTMKELGKIVGVSESAISQYETGKRGADFETLLRLGEALDCSVDQLLREESVDNYSMRFRENLSDELQLIDQQAFGDEPGAIADYKTLEDVAGGILPLSLEEACNVASILGESMDYLLRDDAKDSAREEKEKSLNAAEAAPGDEMDEEIKKILPGLSQEQKRVVLALLRALVAEGPEALLSAQGSEAGPTAESPNQ